MEKTPPKRNLMQNLSIIACTLASLSWTLKAGDTAKMAGTRLLESKEVVVQGVKQRVTVTENNFKYPLRRVQETLDGNKRVVGREEMVANQLVVKVQPKTNIEALVKQLGGKILEKVSDDTYLIEFADSSVASLPRSMERYRAEKSQVLRVSPNMIFQVDAVPNDSHFGKQWALLNTGSNLGNNPAYLAPNCDVKASSAWNFGKGSKTVRVAVLDTGIDFNHPDLAKNMWSPSPAEAVYMSGGIPFADLHGMDFYSNDGNSMDEHGHGTKVAGIIGAVGNNQIGICGVCWNVSLLSVRVAGADGNGSLSDLIKGIEYAIARKVDVINCSLGFYAMGKETDAFPDLRAAIVKANNNGIVVVAAAGNNAINLDLSASGLKHYPSSYRLSGLISVAATEGHDFLYISDGKGSNYGATSVDLAAPGLWIQTTALNNQYDLMTGTSAACPHVSGTCALLKASPSAFNLLFPKSLIPNYVKKSIMNGADKVPGLNGKTVSGGRLNTSKAIELYK